MVMLLHVPFLLLLVWTAHAQYPTSFVGPANSVFGVATQFSMTRLAALVDVNNDRRTDCIVISDQNGIDVLLEPDARLSSANIFASASPKMPEKFSLLAGSSFKGTIRGITASDFNGDSVADLLVLVGDSTSTKFAAHICLGFVIPESQVGFGLKEPELLGNFLYQPMIGDFNADGIADVYGAIAGGKRAIAFGGPDMKLVEGTVADSEWSAQSYAAFGDFTAASTPAHLIALGNKSFEFLANAFVAKRDQLPDTKFASMISLPADIKAEVMGQFRFADFNRDMNLDFILPICKTADCVDSSALMLYEFHGKKWTQLGLNLIPPGFSGKGSWSFSLQDSSIGLVSSALAGISHGDIDLDSWTDLTAILTYTDTNKQVYKVPAILKNNGPAGANSVLQFQAYLIPGVDKTFADKPALQLALFDQGEDGVLDLWVTTKDPSAKDTFSTRLLMQTQSSNNYFLMVMTLSGLCPNKPNCMGYGVPIPGSSAEFKTYGIDGNLFNAIGVTAPLSTCSALEMPYMMFGLGEVANYIEEVTVRILSDHPSTNPLLQRSIEFIVPESQLVVNPYSRLEPSDWRITLFLQPLKNMKVLLIAVTLVALMLFLAILISVMQCIAVRKEREEKLQEVHGNYF